MTPVSNTAPVVPLQFDGITMQLRDGYGVYMPQLLADLERCFDALKRDDLPVSIILKALSRHPAPGAKPVSDYGMHMRVVRSVLHVVQVGNYRYFLGKQTFGRQLTNVTRVPIAQAAAFEAAQATHGPTAMAATTPANPIPAAGVPVAAADMAAIMARLDALEAKLEAQIRPLNLAIAAALSVNDDGLEEEGIFIAPLIRKIFLKICGPFEDATNMDLFPGKH